MLHELHWLRAAALIASFALHAGAYTALGKARASTAVPRGPTQVEFQVVEPAQPPPAPELPEPEEPDPGDEAEPAVPAATAAVPEAPPAEAEPPEALPADEPVNLTGVTLTNDGDGPGWSSAVGDGSQRQGPLRRPTAPRNTKPRTRGDAQPAATVARRARAKPKAPTIVPASDLSRPPRPPVLAGRLLSHYPPDAKRRGLAGRAVVRARIDADGTVRQAQVVSESAPGFGAACRATVLGSNWSAPLDQSGRPVATRISYTCRFQVNR